VFRIGGAMTLPPAAFGLLLRVTHFFKVWRHKDEQKTRARVVMLCNAALGFTPFSSPESASQPISCMKKATYHENGPFGSNGSFYNTRRRHHHAYDSRIALILSVSAAALAYVANNRSKAHDPLLMAIVGALFPEIYLTQALVRHVLGNYKIEALGECPPQGHVRHLR
jgi:hypothetical protein